MRYSDLVAKLAELLGLSYDITQYYVRDYSLEQLIVQIEVVQSALQWSAERTRREE